MSVLRQKHDELMTIYNQTKGISSKPVRITEESIIIQSLHEFVRDDEFDENHKDDCEFLVHPRFPSHHSN